MEPPIFSPSLLRMLNDALTLGADVSLEAQRWSSDAALSAALTPTAAASAIMRINTLRIVDDFFDCDAVHKYGAGLLTAGRTDDAGGLHLVHDFAGLVVAYAETALEH